MSVSSVYPKNSTRSAPLVANANNKLDISSLLTFFLTGYAHLENNMVKTKPETNNSNKLQTSSESLKLEIF